MTCCKDLAVSGRGYQNTRVLPPPPRLRLRLRQGTTTGVSESGQSKPHLNICGIFACLPGSSLSLLNNNPDPILLGQRPS